MYHLYGVVHNRGEIDMLVAGIGLENDRLKELRLKKGRAVYGLATRAGVSPTTITACERWWHRPSEAVRTRLAQALGVEANYLGPETTEPDHE
jgi:transcriptional regulator with XRE-family HTH domain